MNLNPYIESGILELYVLGLLNDDEKIGVDRMIDVYPVLRNELHSIEAALENYAISNKIDPDPAVKQKIFNDIDNFQKEKEMDIYNLPLINKHSNYQNWLKLVDNICPTTLENGLFIKLLQHDNQIMQSLIVAEINIPEETHELEYESFLILKGEVNCIINGKSNIMGPGDFMAIPLYETHDVEIRSPRVTAILQRIKV